MKFEGYKLDTTVAFLQHRLLFLLSAQGAALGLTSKLTFSPCKGGSTSCQPQSSGPYRAEFVPDTPLPGLRPGLTEPALQAGNARLVHRLLVKESVLNPFHQFGVAPVRFLDPFMDAARRHHQ
jgi:hypothetical protein